MQTNTLCIPSFNIHNANIHFFSDMDKKSKKKAIFGSLTGHVHCKLQIF